MNEDPTNVYVRRREAWAYADLCYAALAKHVTTNDPAKMVEQLEHFCANRRAECKRRIDMKDADCTDYPAVPWNLIAALGVEPPK